MTDAAPSREVVRARWAGEYRDIDDGPGFDPEDRLNEQDQIGLFAVLGAEY